MRSNREIYANGKIIKVMENQNVRVGQVETVRLDLAHKTLRFELDGKSVCDAIPLQLSDSEARRLRPAVSIHSIGDSIEIVN